MYTKSAPVKICQMITSLAPAGAEKCVYQLATQLPKDRFEVHVAALKGGSVADDLRAAGIKTHILDIRCRFDIPKFIELKKLFVREQFQLLHTHLFHAGMIGQFAAAKANIPHVIHSEHIVEKRFMPWRFWWARLTQNSRDKIIGVSQAVKQHHSSKSGINPDNYQVIYNGIDTERFRPDAELRNEARKSLNISENQTMCLFLGRLDKQKGINTLLEGFLRAAISHPKLVLVIAGQGPLAHLIKNAQNDALYGDRIISLGFRNDCEKLLNACDFLCMPSRWEGFGLSAAEAMACGKAVIASDIEGLNEVVLGGRSGILLPSGDTEVLAASMGILSASQSLRNEMGEVGLKRVHEKFSQNNFINAHADLYSKALHNE